MPKKPLPDKWTDTEQYLKDPRSWNVLKEKEADLHSLCFLLVSCDRPINVFDNFQNVSREAGDLYHRLIGCEDEELQALFIHTGTRNWERSFTDPTTINPADFVRYMDGRGFKIPAKFQALTKGEAKQTAPRPENIPEHDLSGAKRNAYTVLYSASKRGEMLTSTKLVLAMGVADPEHSCGQDVLINKVIPFLKKEYGVKNNRMCGYYIPGAWGV